MIELTMLPAKDGDCLLLSYGPDGARTNVLIDAGRKSTYPLIKPRLQALGPRGLDLIVVTHVDQDHILGILELFADPDRIAVQEVWFNGYDHLKDVQLETFGARDGELLTSALVAQDVPWNRAFDGRAVEVGHVMVAPHARPDFRVLAPDRGLLERLVPDWEKECKAHGLIPGVDPVPVPPVQGLEQFGTVDVKGLAETPFALDPSKTNGSSIAFLFEDEGVRILFTGDGDDARIVESLRPLAQAEGGRLRLDALKVSHHGSAGNLSNDLLELIDCPRYLISTNGDRHGHPDPIALSRILVHGGPQKEVCFNYRDRAQLWDVPEWQDEYGLRVVTAPPDDDGSLTLTWRD